jgi:AraC family transcriptional regulator
MTDPESDPVAAPGLPASSAMWSSHGRGWHDVQAFRRRHTLSDLHAPAMSSHLVVVHLKPSLEVRGGIDGGLQVRRYARAGLKIVPAGRSSEWHWRAHRPPSDALHLHVSHDLLRGAAAAAGADPDRIELRDHFGALDPEIAVLGSAFRRELATGGAAGPLYAQSLASALAVILLRRYSTAGPSGDRPPADLSHRALRRATDHIESHLHTHISLADLAAAGGVSPHHFARLFKAATGESPHQYVIRRRVERAQQLLSTTDLPLRDVAVHCGFAHQAHLTRHFGRLVGVPPGRFRAS